MFANAQNKVLVEPSPMLNGKVPSTVPCQRTLCHPWYSHPPISTIVKTGPVMSRSTIFSPFSPIIWANILLSLANLHTWWMTMTQTMSDHPIFVSPPNLTKILQIILLHLLQVHSLQLYTPHIMVISLHRLSVPLANVAKHSTTYSNISFSSGSSQ